MTELLKPADARQVEDILAWACGSETPLEVVGAGTKRALGRPLQVAHSLDLSGLSGITLYEPDELVMAAGPGTPLAVIEAALAANRQQLAFEPADYGPLLGGQAGLGTIGGVFACNLAGPRRVSSGASRDHILGVRCVGGNGVAFKAGGRVVKNVTGFDLPKLLAGSYGTLAVITELTFKVLPAPEAVRTVLLAGLDAGRAVAAMTLALQSSHEVSGAAHLPGVCAGRSKVAAVSGAGDGVTAIRVEGPEPSVVHRAAALRRELAEFGDAAELDSDASRDLWRELRDAAPFVGRDGAVWRLALPPASGARVVEGILAEWPGEYYLDRGGGTAWLAMPETDAATAAVRSAVAAVGGTATLLRASAETRGHVDVFQPLPEPLRRLSARVKEAFDPRRILNPGRMYPGL